MHFIFLFVIISIEEFQSSNNFYFIPIGSKTAILGKNTTEDDNALVDSNIEIVKIPKTLQQYTITTIGKYAFRSNNIIKEIIIPNTVLEICRDAIAHMNSLTTVTFEKGTTIANLMRGFIYNTNITDFVIPRSVSHIDVYAFGNSTFNSITYCGIYQFTEEMIFYSTYFKKYTYPKNIYVSKHYPYSLFGSVSNLKVTDFCDNELRDQTQCVQNIPVSNNFLFLLVTVFIFHFEF